MGYPTNVINCNAVQCTLKFSLGAAGLPYWRQDPAKAGRGPATSCDVGGQLADCAGSVLWALGYFLKMEGPH